MTRPEDLKAKAERMQAYLETRIPSEPQDLIDRVNNLSIMIAQTSSMLADAKYYQDTVVNGAIMEALQKAYEEKLSASTINKFVQTAAKEHNYLVNWIDRLNSAGVHQLDALRSVISYKKAEMQIL